MNNPEALLRELELLHITFDQVARNRKIKLLVALDALVLPSAAQTLRLHEMLCFVRAYPDDHELLSLAEAMLKGFAHRTDLHKYAGELADSGLAGTPIHYEFYHQMASWLTAHWPDRLRIDWDSFATETALDEVLSLLGLYCESPGLDDLGYSAREWLDLMKGPGETDAAFLVRRAARLKMDGFMREKFFEGLAVPMVLDAGPQGPSRTEAWTRIQPPHFQATALRKGRPDLKVELRGRSIPLKPVSRAKGEEILDLARTALVTRSRDLDAFAFGDPADVRLADGGQGLTIALIGMVPERRLMFETVYGYLLLKNGVPVGYGVISALFHSVEVAFNVFDTFRGVEAGFVFGRLLKVLRGMFKARTFTLFPYQLGGEGNEEGLASGAWWFYQKLGFRPRDGELLEVMEQELELMRRKRGHRSGRRILKRLASANVYYDLGSPRRNVMGELPLGVIGSRITSYLAQRFGSRRDRAGAVCGREAARLLGVPLPQSSGPRLAWERWAPLVLILPGVSNWSREEKRALAAVVKAKGARRESDFAIKFDAHTKLRRAFLALGQKED
jgi:hypothetical protein